MITYPVSLEVSCYRVNQWYLCVMLEEILRVLRPLCREGNPVGHFLGMEPDSREHLVLLHPALKYKQIAKCNV
jgi:hypothetical protein